MSEENEMLCPACFVERADYEGPNGAWLPKCPNCGSEADPVSAEGLEDDPAALIVSIVDTLIGNGDPTRDAQQLSWAIERKIREIVHLRLEPYQLEARR